MDVNSSVLHVRWGVVPRFTSGEAFASKPCLYQAARHCLLPKARGMGDWPLRIFHKTRWPTRYDWRSVCENASRLR